MKGRDSVTERDEEKRRSDEEKQGEVTENKGVSVDNNKEKGSDSVTLQSMNKEPNLPELPVSTNPQNCVSCPGCGQMFANPEALSSHLKFNPDHLQRKEG